MFAGEHHMGLDIEQAVSSPRSMPGRRPASCHSSSPSTAGSGEVRSRRHSLGTRSRAHARRRSRQNVHSKEQIIASADAGGRSAAQFSQIGRSSRAMTTLSPVTDRDRNDGVPTIQVTVSRWVVASIEPIGRRYHPGRSKHTRPMRSIGIDITPSVARFAPTRSSRIVRRVGSSRPQACMRPPTKRAELLGAHTEQSTEPDGSVHGS